jgi:fluoride ion exporter CrcB/FEX
VGLLGDVSGTWSANVVGAFLLGPWAFVPWGSANEGSANGGSWMTTLRGTGGKMNRERAT